MVTTDVPTSNSFFATNKRRILLGVIVLAALVAIGWQAYQYFQKPTPRDAQEIQRQILKEITSPVAPIPDAQKKSILNDITATPKKSTAKPQSQAAQASEDAVKTNILNSLTR